MRTLRVPTPLGRHAIPAALTIALLLSGIAPGGRAEEPPVFAISNARIVTVAGSTIEKGTVVLRNGIIEAVGSEVAIPGDARVIDGTGLTVYPGIIDGLSDIGLEDSRPAAAATSSRTPVPPAPLQQSPQSSDERQGLTPYRQAADMLDSGGRKIASARNAGITSALVAPRGGIFSGQSVLINLSGGEPGRMIVRTPVAFHVSLSGGRGFAAGYPGSLMGIFAFVKQTLSDAAQYEAAWGIYNTSPGVERPEYSRALESLQPLIRRQARTVMAADNPVDIQRVLDLTESCKLDLMLSGAAEAAPIAAVLKERKIPVLLSVKYPERDRNADPDAREELRELRRRAEAPANAAALAAAGVTFAFQSGDTANPRDFIRNVAKAVDAGLDHDTALRALTLTPAEIFGVSDRLGSIESNKTANVIVATGDIFDLETRVKIVFVDGRMFENTETSETAGSSEPAPSAAEEVSGSWSLTVNSSQGAIPVTLILRQSGSAVTGTASSPMGDAPIEEGSVAGGRLTFKVNSGGMKVSFSGSVQGSRVTGTMNVEGMGTMECTGTKSPRAMSGGAEGSDAK